MNSIFIGLASGVIIGIVLTIVIYSLLEDNTTTQAFDLEKIKQINQIDSCVELKKEYQLIKQYDSVIEHSDLYLRAIEDRAKSINSNPNVSCKLQ